MFSCASITRCPAVTNVSLFAIPIVFFASIARSVGNNPTLPTTAFTTISASGCSATSKSPSLPYTIFVLPETDCNFKTSSLFAQRRFAEKIFELPLLRSQYFSLQKKQRDGIGLGASVIHLKFVYHRSACT